MKTVGFIKQYDNESFSNELDTYFKDAVINENRESLIQYMQKGLLCIPLMGAVDNPFDEDDDEFIGYIAVYTDGVYIWPNYVIAFLKKYPNFHLDDEFVKHVKANNQVEFKVEKETLKRFEHEYYALGNWGKESE